MNKNNMEPGEPSRAMMVCRFGYACVGIILGLAVFICFLAAPEYYNLHISLWGFASAFFAFLTLLIHIQHVKGNRDVWVYRLKLFILLGFFTAVGCIIAFIVYLAIAIAENQVLLPVNGSDQQKGYYLASIWVFMTWKWSFALFLTSRAYRRTYTTRLESNCFFNFILYGNMLFCFPGDIPSRPLEEEMA